MAFSKDTIGVIGHGFVGEALEKGMKHAFKVLVHDPFKYPDGVRVEDKQAAAEVKKLGGKLEYVGLNLVGTMEELTQQAEVIFVCVPTPMNPNGSASTKIVDRVVASIAEFNRKNVVVIKSTVPPGTTQRLQMEFGSLAGVIFNPEFLTEANYINDFKNQTRIILGGHNDRAKSIVKQVYQHAYPNVKTIKTSSTIAEMVKYTTNTFLATKVSFANEIHDVCKELGVDYDKVIEYARYDERLGNTHWAVPGPDGHYGFGGSCFPKDINALIARMKELGLTPRVIQAAWEKNLDVRPEKDWEQLKGRAVVKDE